MKILARDYQAFAKQSIFTYFQKEQGNPIVAAPTGTGKSVIIADFLYDVFRYWPRQKVMVLTHVKELIQQNYDKFIQLWPNAPAGVYSSGLGRRDTMNSVIFAGIGSVAKRAAVFGHVDLILIDECHLVNPEEEGNYRKFIAALRETNPMLKVIGFTATPWRLGHGHITEGGIFTDVCCDMTTIDAFNWFIAQGYLVPLVPKKTELELDTEGVHKRGGEFIQGELQTAVDKEETTRAALEEALRTGGDRQAWLIFAAGVEHAIHISDILNEMGVPCAAVHSKMGDKERDTIIADFKSGKLRAVANNNVLTTGFDHPGIDLILMLRPTASSVLWVQMLGRGTRPNFLAGYDLSTVSGRLASIAASGKKNCLVLDFAGNTRRLGPVNDPVVPKKKGEKGGDAPVRLCEACGTYNHASARACFHCGAEFTFQTKLKMAASTADLIKGDLPIVEVFRVDHITYLRHEKMGKPPMMRVTYYSGLRAFSEYVCMEHEGFAGGKARRWWRERCMSSTMPDDTEAALEMTNDLRPATHLRVWVNKTYPEIMAVCMDGTAFGTQAPSTTTPEVKTVKTVTRKPSQQILEAPADAPTQVPRMPGPVKWDDMDDDIPF